MKNAPKIIKEVFDITGEAWLFGATLLGPIRDGKIVAWDRDVDLGILSFHVNDELVEKFREKGFNIISTYKLNIPEMKQYLGDDLPMGKIYGKVILNKDGVKVELCCFTRGIDGRYYYASGTPRFFVLEADMILPLTKKKIYDFEVNVPENSEKQLAFVYGDNWKTPIKDWYFTPAHYKCRERTIIELKGDDGTKWSKWTGRKVIKRAGL